MSKFRNLCVLLVLLGVVMTAEAKRPPERQEFAGYLCSMYIVDNDTFPIIGLKPVYVYERLTFKDKNAEKFYWRTVRDVKAVLPLAHYIRGVVIQTNDTLMEMETKRQRDKYMKGFEKSIYKENEERFSDLTLNQGKLLIRLVDREFNTSTYDLIKAYRGGFRAGFYQVFAKVLGADLKDTFGSKEQDEMVDRIIQMVEDGDM